MSQLTQTRLYFDDDGNLAVTVHREADLSFTAIDEGFKGLKAVTLDKTEYDICASDLEVLKLAQPHVESKQPELAQKLQARIDAKEAERAAEIAQKEEEKDIPPNTDDDIAVADAEAIP